MVEVGQCDGILASQKCAKALSRGCMAPHHTVREKEVHLHMEPTGRIAGC